MAMVIRERPIALMNNPAILGIRKHPWISAFISTNEPILFHLFLSGLRGSSAIKMNACGFFFEGKAWIFDLGVRAENEHLFLKRLQSLVVVAASVLAASQEGQDFPENLLSFKDAINLEDDNFVLNLYIVRANGYLSTSVG